MSASVAKGASAGASKVQLLRNRVVIADKCEVADRFLARLLGLMGRSGLPEGGGMFFPRCRSIHMGFMRFPIDVVFVEAEGRADYRALRVTSVHRGVRPWRPLPVSDLSASHALELPAGTADRHGIQPGDELCIS